LKSVDEPAGRDQRAVIAHLGGDVLRTRGDVGLQRLP
jgi:hypothetical protein